MADSIFRMTNLTVWAPNCLILNLVSPNPLTTLTLNLVIIREMFLEWWFGLFWKEGRKNVLFNDALNTFCLRLYGVGHMIVRGNPLPPHGLLFPINSKGSFICTIAQTG